MLFRAESDWTDRYISHLGQFMLNFIIFYYVGYVTSMAIVGALIFGGWDVDITLAGMVGATIGYIIGGFLELNRLRRRQVRGLPVFGLYERGVQYPHGFRSFIFVPYPEISHVERSRSFPKGSVLLHLGHSGRSLRASLPLRDEELEALGAMVHGAPPIPMPPSLVLYPGAPQGLGPGITTASTDHIEPLDQPSPPMGIKM